MKFEFKHTFDVDVEELERAIFHEKLAAFLQEKVPSVVKIEPLERDDGPDFIERKVRYEPVPMIKKVGPKKVPPEAMIWVEESKYDKKRRMLTFDNVPTHPKVKKLMSNRGTIRLSSLGPGRCERRMESELKIKVPILGRIAEKMIFKSAGKIIEEEAVAMKAFLRSDEFKEK